MPARVPPTEYVGKHRWNILAERRTRGYSGRMVMAKIPRRQHRVHSSFYFPRHLFDEATGKGTSVFSIFTNYRHPSGR